MFFVTKNVFYFKERIVFEKKTKIIFLFKIYEFSRKNIFSDKQIIVYEK